MRKRKITIRKKLLFHSQRGRKFGQYILGDMRLTHNMSYWTGNFYLRSRPPSDGRRTRVNYMREMRPINHCYMALGVATLLLSWTAP